MLWATLVMVGAAVRWMDLRLRREFAARELMLMVIEAQRREMEAALNVAAELGREMEAVAKYINRKGRVRISALAQESNKLIDLKPRAESAAAEADDDEAS